MLKLASTLRRTASSALIRMGPNNALVITLLDRECKKFGASLQNCGTYLRLRKGQREMLLAPKHFVYAPVLAERFDIYFDDLVPKKVDGSFVLDYSKPGNLQTYSQTGLQFHMSSFPEEISAIEDYFHWYKPQEGDLVMDVGAHCGVSTFHFSNLVGMRGRVVALEPDPVNYSLLIRNIELHKLGNVEAHQIALAGTCGKEPFSAEESIGSTLMRHSTRESVGTVVMVETITLEKAFARWGTPQFCKIDIEGSEIEVMESSLEFLKAAGPRCQFAMDTNHFVGGKLTSDRIEEFFGKAGFEAESSTSGLKTTWARPVATQS